jgi:hypothetical protein
MGEAGGNCGDEIRPGTGEGYERGTGDTRRPSVTRGATPGAGGIGLSRSMALRGMFASERREGAFGSLCGGQDGRCGGVDAGPRVSAGGGVGEAGGGAGGDGCRG